MDDWWLIERAEHDGRESIRTVGYGLAFMSSARLGTGDNNCDIEGSGEEMLAIADAIERGDEALFKRCAAVCMPDGVDLESPRNSREPVRITRARALELAADIRAKVTP